MDLRDAVVAASRAFRDQVAAGETASMDEAFMELDLALDALDGWGSVVIPPDGHGS